MSVVTPIRSRPGSRSALRANGSAGGGAQDASPGSGPASTSSSCAVSRTVRVSTPSTTSRCWPTSGACETRPRCGLRPTRPQHAAGIRSDPPPSLPCASGTIAAATAAADPPDEPPGVRPGSHGLRVGPKRRGSVTGRIPHSGMLVVPTTTKPAARSRRVTLWSRGATLSPVRAAPRVRRSPWTARLFLIAIGTPANGRSSPDAIAPAAARAPSWSTSTNALIARSTSSMRRSEASTSSGADSCPERTSAASSSAGRRMSSASEEAKQRRLRSGAREPRSAVVPGRGTYAAYPAANLP